MNREQKAATIEAIAKEIDGSEAVFAVDYRGLSVPQAAELRTKLREAEASFTVVKNSLTERAADQVGADSLKPLLTGPTALAFVRGDAAMAAKAIADYARATQLLPFKGGLLNGEALEAEQIRAISRLPAREVLYGQLVGIVASPVSGLVRTLNALVGGLAVALGQVQVKKESGELPAGEPPAAPEAKPEPEPVPGAEAAPVEETVPEPEAEAASVEEATPEPEPEAAPVGDATPEPEPEAEGAPAEDAAADQAEPAEPAQDDNQTDASEQDPDSAEATKED